MLNFLAYLENRRKRVDKALHGFLPAPNTKPAHIHKAMHYSVFNGGKRVRPILCLAACEAAGASPQRAMQTACALELLHTYSLIHDDLPCMDDDDMRRGKPTSHKVFGEGMAVLAGDALLTYAFELLAMNDAKVPAPLALKIIGLIAKASGSQNLIGGQVADLEAEGKKLALSQLRTIHMHKTAALIEASVKAGAMIGSASKAQLTRLSAYGRNIGLAFQVADDILDVTGDEQKMGKRLRKDAGMRKATYPGIVGLENARAYLRHLTQSAVGNLAIFGEEAEPLRAMARFIASREH